MPEILLEDDLIELDVAVLESYTGEYHALFPDGSETTIRISRVGKYLTVSDIDSNLLSFFSLYPLSPDRYIMKSGSLYGPQLDFQKDDNAKISQIIIDDELVIELTLIE